MGATTPLRAMALASAVAAALLVIAGSRVVSANYCDDNMQALINYCLEFVEIGKPPEPPSVGCCRVVKHTDIPCFCNHVNKEFGKIISMEKAVYVAKYCEQPLMPGTKCGNYSVPPYNVGVHPI